MSRSLVLVAALALSPLATACHHGGGAAAPHPSDTLTLPLAPRAVGMKWTKTDDTGTDLTITAGDQQVHLGVTRHFRTENEILAVDANGIVTKVAITYAEHRSENVGPGAEDEPSPIAHQSYIVWVEGGAGGTVAATHADGSPVSAEELAAIAAEEDDLGQPPVMEQTMARTWKRGARVDLGADELARLNDRKGGAHSSAMSLTLTAIAGDEATFAMTMKMDDAAHGLTIDVTGTAVVDARTGRPHRIELAGPLTGTTGGMPVTGTMTSLVTYAFHD